MDAKLMADYGELILAAYGLANIVARITPTKKDDRLMGKVGKFLNFLFLWSKQK